jgi:hypothetical protein
LNHTVADVFRMFAADAAAKQEASLVTEEDRLRFLSAARALLAADPEFSNRVRGKERTKLLSDDIGTPEMGQRIIAELWGAIARLAREAVGTQRYLTEEELAHAIAAAPSPSASSSSWLSGPTIREPAGAP